MALFKDVVSPAPKKLGFLRACPPKQIHLKFLLDAFWDAEFHVDYDSLIKKYLS